MKRFLLLALTAGLLSPIAANAESKGFNGLRHNGSMENDWLSEFQKYFFRTLGAASGLVAIPIAIGLGWLLLIFGSNIARNPELKEYQKCALGIYEGNIGLTQKMIDNPDQVDELMKQQKKVEECGERPKEWRWQ